MKLLFKMILYLTHLQNCFKKERGGKWDREKLNIIFSDFLKRISRNKGENAYENNVKICQENVFLFDFNSLSTWIIIKRISLVKMNVNCSWNMPTLHEKFNQNEDWKSLKNHVLLNGIFSKRWLKTDAVRMWGNAIKYLWQ